jgi:hypothetical protein
MHIHSLSVMLLLTPCQIWKFPKNLFELSHVSLYAYLLFQVDPDLPTFRPIEQQKNSDIKYTANGYIPCKG